MNIFQRAGHFIAREYAFLPKALRRGAESVVFTSGGAGIGSLIMDYGNLPFAHTPIGVGVGTIAVAGLGRAVQAYLIARGNAAKDEAALDLTSVADGAGDSAAAAVPPKVSQP